MNTLSFRRKRNSASENLQREYLDWVNEWLYRRVEPIRIFSLQYDFRNGVAFAALIELVGGVTLYGIEGKPTTKAQQDENINSCLEFLAQRGLQPINVPNSNGITAGDLVNTMNLLHQISKLDPQAKLKPPNKTTKTGSRLDRQHSERLYSYYTANGVNEFTKSATIGPCMAKSLPVLNRSYDNISSSDVMRRSTELLSPNRVRRPNSFDLSPNTPVILEDGDFDDEGIIQIGQKKIRESLNNKKSETTPNPPDYRLSAPQSIRLRRNAPIMDNVMLKVNGNHGNHAIRHSKPLLNGPVSPIHPMSPIQTCGSTTASKEVFDHLICEKVNNFNSNSNLAVNVSTECLSNTDNNSSRCNSICERNNSSTSLQWDNTGLRTNNANNGEDRACNEIELLNQIKWLKRELEKSKGNEEASQEHLNTNSHMLTAFQQSIESLTNRLEHETKLNEQKEHELQRLRSQSVDRTESSGKSTTLQHASHGSFSDFSDCDNEHPGHFDRSKKKRRSWKGSLTRAFSRKKKSWEDEWDTSPTKPRELFLSPEDLAGRGPSTYSSPETSNSDSNKISNDVCRVCQQNQTKISAMKIELDEMRSQTKPPHDSLVNYIREEKSDRKVLYRIAVTVQCHNTQYTVGSVGITDTTTWTDLDNMIISCLAKHLQLIDPGKQLGLRTSSIANYTLDSVTRAPKHDTIPTVDLRSMRGAIVISLRSGCSCDNITYDTLLPVSFLKIAQSALKMEHFICLSGARYSGKTYTAELLGKNLLEELRPHNNDVISHNVIVYEADELVQPEAVETFHKRLSTSTRPVVAVVNDYTASNINQETIKLIRDSPGYKNSFVILITEEAPKQELKNVRIVRCSAQCEPFLGLLDRHFNRILSILPPERRPKLKHIFNWLSSVWRHVNETLKQHVDGTCLIGPTHFFSCPADLERTEVWFLALWNMTLTPYIIDTVKSGLEVYGRKHTCWADPVEFIKGSYPWTSSKEYCDLLQGIHSSELNYDAYRTGPLIGGSSILSQDQVERVVSCLRDHLRMSSGHSVCSTTPSTTPRQSSRDVSRDNSSSRDDDPVPPARTTSVVSSLSSGSDEGLMSIRSEEHKNTENSLARRNARPQNGVTPTKPTSPPKHSDSPPHRHIPHQQSEQNGHVTNYGNHGNHAFQRGAVGRQSLPGPARPNGDFHNMYYRNNGPAHRSKAFNNLGKV